MESLPLLISVGSLMTWVLTMLFAPVKSKATAFIFGMAFALIQLGASIWATVRVFGNTTGVSWSGIWFRLSTSDAFEIKLLTEPISAVLWLMLSLFAAISTYFALLHGLRGSRPVSRGEALATPLLSLGALLAIISGNFITYYFGWALINFVGFMAVGQSVTARGERSKNSYRYVMLNMIPELLFSAGVLSCYANAGTFDFTTLNERGASVIPVWAIVSIVVGTMLRSMQLPLMQCARYVASARWVSLPVLIIGHCVMAPTIFAKIYPMVSSVDNIAWLGVIPSLTALAAALLALPEEDPHTIAGWLTSYLSASVFLSGLAGDYQAVQALALAGIPTIFLLASTMTELPVTQSAGRWFITIAALSLTGIPLSSWGWARYLEYVGMLNAGESVGMLEWFLLGTKVLADLIMGLVVWGIARERWFSRRSQENTSWDVVIPLGLVSLGCISLLIGGRPFSGVVGAAGVEYFPAMTWFEKLITAPAGITKNAFTALELVGSDIDILARIIGASAFVLPALVGILWIFRDPKSLSEFRAFCQKIAERLGQKNRADSILWAWIIRPISIALGKAANTFDMKVVDYLVSDMWAKPARIVRNAFSVFETAFVDKKLVDGLGEAVATIGKSLRLLQNGQVQFYFAIGLILMGSIVIKFIVSGG